MDNPTFFTVLWRAEDLDWDLTDAGLFGSIRGAGGEAAKRQADTDVPDLKFTAAVVSMLDPDPVTGTPLGHINPPRATGYALASLSVADSDRRSLDHTLHTDFATARGIAEAGRSRYRARGDDTVVDVVAITIAASDTDLNV